jgi:hypothetical protein
MQMTAMALLNQSNKCKWLLKYKYIKYRNYSSWYYSQTLCNGNVCVQCVAIWSYWLEKSDCVYY